MVRLGTGWLLALLLAAPVSAEFFFDDDELIPERTSLIDTLAEVPEGVARAFADQPGANFPCPPLWSPHHIKLVDVTAYPHITSLDNDDPNSFWYTYRPNLFNEPIEDEWDWFNLINTQRPDFTDTPFSAGRGVTILETGYSFTRTRGVEQPSDARTLPEAFFRYGLTDELEAQIKWNGYIGIDTKDPMTGQTLSTFGTFDTYVGVKYEFWQQNNWVPMTTCDVGMLLPTGTNGLSGNHVQPHANVVTGWGLRRFLYLKHQFGYDYVSPPTFSIDSSGPNPILVASRPIIDSFHSSISLMFQASKRFGGFAEWFCTYGREQQTIHYTDYGLFYYVTPNVQFDTVIGSSIGSDYPTILFMKAGISTRW